MENLLETEMPPELIDLPNTPEFQDFWAHCPFRWQGDHGAMVWLDRLYNWGRTPPAPRPGLTMVNPSSGVENASVTIDLLGNNFVSGAVAVFGGVDVPVTFVSVSRLTATGVLLSRPPGAYPVAVRNPDNQISVNQTFTVTAAEA